MNWGMASRGRLQITSKQVVLAVLPLTHFFCSQIFTCCFTSLLSCKEQVCILSHSVSGLPLVWGENLRAGRSRHDGYFGWMEDQWVGSHWRIHLSAVDFFQSLCKLVLDSWKHSGIWICARWHIWACCCKSYLGSHVIRTRQPTCGVRVWGG